MKGTELEQVFVMDEDGQLTSMSLDGTSDFVTNKLNVETNDLNNASSEEFYTKQIREKIHKNSIRHEKLTEIKQENILLHQRLTVAETLCGFRKDDYVIYSTIKIQSFIRGWILRLDKANFNAAVNLFLLHCKGFLEKKRYKSIRQKITKIQSVFRGNVIRKTPVGKATKNIIVQMKNIIDLELIVLRMVSSEVEKKCVLVE